MIHFALATTILVISLAANARTPSEIYEQAAKSTVVIRNFDGTGKPQSMGSGVVLPNKDIATNCHVIKNAGQIKIRIDKKEYPALLRYSDWERDVCSLSVSGIAAPPIEVGSTKRLKVGARVYAIGAPKGLELSLSEGIVSSLREARGGRYIQTTAAISPGSSGGGLYDEDGTLIGLTTFYLAEGQNLNFALPVEWIEELPNRTKQTPMSDRPETWWMARSSELEGQQNYQEMLTHCKRWTEAHPENPVAWNDLGAAYHSLGMLANAVAAYQKALQLNPEFFTAWSNLGITWGRLRDHPKAIEALRQAIAINPEYVNAWYSLGNIYGATEKTDQAIEAHKQVLRINPEHVGAWRGIGLGYGMNRQYEKAISAYQQVVRLAPADADSWMMLGVNYALTKQRDKVIEVYKHLKTLDASRAEQFFRDWVAP
jgi:Flp pilus assembly protein TadD